MYFNKNLIENKDTKKDTATPINNIIISKIEKEMPNLNNFNILAPNIIGIDKKNENSVAIYLDVPNIIPPKIVAPDLEVPGIKDKS